MVIKYYLHPVSKSVWHIMQGGRKVGYARKLDGGGYAAEVDGVRVTGGSIERVWREAVAACHPKGPLGL